MKKTVCFVNTHYFPMLGGITQYTHNLIKELQTRDVNAIVITLNVFNLPEFEITEGVEIYRLPCISLMDGRFPIIRFNRYCKNKMFEIAKSKIDLIVINARFYMLSLYMARFARKKRIPSIIIDHGSSHLTMGSKIITKFGECYEHIVTKMLKHYCKDFYGVSRASCNWLSHFGIQARDILYNAVDLDFISETLENPTKDYRVLYDLPIHAKIVSFTGRLVAEKGVLQLVEAIANVRDQDPSVYLFIAGDGPLKKQLEEQKREGIAFLGQIDLAAIISLLKQSLMLCLPSASEGFPTSVLEAVACKCFVAATKVGGAAEIIPTTEYGILLEKNDVKHIEKAIHYVLSEPEKVKESVAMSYERMVNNFTWKKTADKVYKILI